MGKAPYRFTGFDLLIDSTNSSELCPQGYGGFCPHPQSYGLRAMPSEPRGILPPPFRAMPSELCPQGYGGFCPHPSELCPQSYGGFRPHPPQSYGGFCPHPSELCPQSYGGFCPPPSEPWGRTAHGKHGLCAPNVCALKMYISTFPLYQKCFYFYSVLIRLIGLSRGVSQSNIVTFFGI